MSYYDKMTESDLDRRGYPLGNRLWERIRRERLQPRAVDVFNPFVSGNGCVTSWQ
jgi:hypothetical protein